jgi:hypothetical protein
LGSLRKSKEPARRRLMNTERSQVGWGFWFWWAGLALGLAVGFFATVISYTIFFFSELDVVGEVLNLAVGGAVAGALLGSVQRRYLRRLALPTDWWMLATTVGGAVGGVAALVVEDAMIFAMLFAVSGASVGIAQWLVLRRQVAQAGLWVLASTVGGAVGGAVALVVSGQIQTMKTLGDIYIIPTGCGAMALALAGYGVITGGVLVYLLRQPGAKDIAPRQAAE